MKKASPIVLAGCCLILVHGLAAAACLDSGGYELLPDGTGSLTDDAEQETPQGQPRQSTTTAPRRRQGTAAGAQPALPAQPASPGPSTTQPRTPGTTPGAAQPPAPSDTTPSTTTASSLRADLERSLSEELSSSTFSNESGDLGSLSAISSGGIPQMIGDLGPLPSLSALRLAAGGSGLPPPFPPPKPPGVPRPRGASVVVPSIR
ncbi:MAG TPA: hypothetical protein VKA15_26030, partial [Isosphaeraceae bacterium]|nr:hypothetical protein [Isosphaeraceae bacterium]